MTKTKRIKRRSENKIGRRKNEDDNEKKKKRILKKKKTD